MLVICKFVFQILLSCITDGSRNLTSLKNNICVTLNGMSSSTICVFIFRVINFGKMFLRYDKRERKPNNTFCSHVLSEINNVLVFTMIYVLLCLKKNRVNTIHFAVYFYEIDYCYFIVTLKMALET